jgi:hypothetical protein
LVIITLTFAFPARSLIVTKAGACRKGESDSPHVASRVTRWGLHTPQSRFMAALRKTTAEYVDALGCDGSKFVLVELRASFETDSAPEREHTMGAK